MTSYIKRVGEVRNSCEKGAKRSIANPVMLDRSCGVCSSCAHFRLVSLDGEGECMLRHRPAGGGDAACVAARLRDKAMKGLGCACGVMVVLFPVMLMAAACAWAARLALGAFGAL